MAEPQTLNLLHRSREGDAEALDTLFEKERSRLRRLLRVRAHASVLARLDVDDLLQETYVEALQQLPNYDHRGPDSFFKWLATLAINRMRNASRAEDAEKRSRKREVRIASAETVARAGMGVSDVTFAAPGPRTLALGQDEAQRLEAALDRLSAVDREVIVMARLESLPIATIARRIGRTPNATALLLSRSLRKLKDHLATGTSR